MDENLIAETDLIGRLKEELSICTERAHNLEEDNDALRKLEDSQNRLVKHMQRKNQVLLDTLKFYAEGEQDGGHRAGRALEEYN